MWRRAVVEPGGDDREVERVVVVRQLLRVLSLLAGAGLEVRDEDRRETGVGERRPVRLAARDDEDPPVALDQAVVEQRAQHAPVEALTLHREAPSCRA